MPLPIHDVTASTANLAKSWLMTLDRTSAESKVPTPTLILWLETLISLAEPIGAKDARDRAQKTLMGMTVESEEAQRAENEAKAARAGVSY